MKKVVTRGTWAILFAIILSCWGCGTLPDMVSADKKEGETYSANEVRQMSVDQPFLMSGDYFREREQAPSVVLDELLGGEENQGNASKETARKSEAVRPAPPKEMKMPSAAATAESAGPVPEPMRKPSVTLPIKVGFVMDGNNIPPETGKRALNALPKDGYALPVLVAAQDKIEEVLSTTACIARKDLLCLSDALSLYPGVRMLILVETITLPQKVPGSAVAKVTVVDTGLPFRYPVMEISAPVQGNDDTDRALAGIWHRVLTFAAQKARAMPWFCRAFSKEGEEWYISAGQRSGLKPGDLLTVIARGKAVKSPTGFPAGWVPGAVRGKVRVRQFFGEDFAVCTLAEGNGPKAKDLLVRP